MLLQARKAGERVNFLYPTHGTGNVLRSVTGVIDKVGRGPNGPFVTVRQDNGDIRSLSEKKIVSW